MLGVATFYSINEIQKQLNRVHHNNSDCAHGRNIPTWDRRLGTGNYKLCGECRRLNREMSASRSATEKKLSA